MVLPASDRISRVPPYSGFSTQQSHFEYGALTLFGRLSQTVLLAFLSLIGAPQPRQVTLTVWACPRSLATTNGVSIDFLSYRYLDVSVPCVGFLSDDRP